MYGCMLYMSVYYTQIIAVIFNTVLNFTDDVDLIVSFLFSILIFFLMRTLMSRKVSNTCIFNKSLKCHCGSMVN